MSKHILIVDDDKSIRTLLRLTFEDAGFEVREASDGEIAMEMVRKSRPELIILDIFMPNQDGYETLQELEKISGIPIFVISGGGRGFAPHLKAAHHLGALMTFPKPFDRKEILAAAQRVLAESS